MFNHRIWTNVTGCGLSGRASISVRLGFFLIPLAASLALLGGCSSSPKLGDLSAPNGGESAAGNANGASAETTGSVVVQPAEHPPGEPIAPLARPGLLGDDPNDDLQRGKRYFRNNDFGLAEKSFRVASERHPRDAEAWVGLAASYDRLHRFDLADRAYQQAIGIVGRTPEILNDQGFSYILRGDYARAQKTLQEAHKKDPENPYIEANMRLLEESRHDGKGVQ
jgi:tetratricopeptide (TPR) repeat protein